MLAATLSGARIQRVIVVCSQPALHTFLVTLCLHYVVAVNYYLLLGELLPPADLAVYSGRVGEKIPLMLL